MWSVIGPMVVEPNWPVVMLPSTLPAPVESRLKPIVLRALRSTSANFTSSKTSWAPMGPKVRTLTTFLEYASPISPARLATSSVETCPLRTMALRDGETAMTSSGKMRWISSAAAVTSTSTRRSKARERSSSSQIRRETSPGVRPCTSTWVGVTTNASATAGSVTEIRLRRSLVLMSRDLPTITRRGAEPCGSADGEVDWGGRVVVAVSGVTAGGWGGGGGGGGVLAGGGENTTRGRKQERAT